MKKLKRPAPGFCIALDNPFVHKGSMREVLPFRRSWLAITIIAIIDLVFLIPAFGVFQEASHSWAKLDSLMDLTFALFTSAWLLGWSLVPIILTLLLIILLFGREVLRAGAGWLEIGIGLPGIVLFIPYDPTRVRNIRLVTPKDKSGTSWRGRHIAFDNGGYQIDFGSALDEGRLSVIKEQLEAASGVVFRNGNATEDELSTEQLPQEHPPSPIQKEIRPESDEVSIDPSRVSVSSFSTLTLIAVNLIPIVGWWLWGWSLSDVMVLYWAESAVVGFYNVCKMALISKWMVLLSGPFFLGHFGAFMAVHFLFIYSIFVQGFDGSGMGDSLGEVVMIFSDLWPALLGLLLSHGVSLFTNFIGRKEYLGKTIKQQMMEPYNRILFMHLVLIFGGGLAMVLGDAGPVILLVILLKIIIDLRAHIQERKGKSSSGANSV